MTNWGGETEIYSIDKQVISLIYQKLLAKNQEYNLTEKKKSGQETQRLFIEKRYSIISLTIEMQTKIH